MMRRQKQRTLQQLLEYPGVRNSNLLQYYCLGNSMDRGVWQATVFGVAKSRTLLSARTHTHTQNMLAPAKVPSEAISKSHLDKVPVCEIHVRHDSGKP